MVTDEAPDKDKRLSLRFGLLIQKSGDGSVLTIESKNEGFPTAEALLIVGAWHEAAMEHFKRPAKDGLYFGGRL